MDNHDSNQPKSFRMQLRMSEKEKKAVDNWRIKQSDIPNRTEAIRRLIKLGLVFKD